MPPLTAVNFVLPRSAVDEVDRRRKYQSRSDFLRQTIEEALKVPVDWGIQDYAGPTTLVTALVGAMARRRIDQYRGKESVSSYLRRLILSRLSLPPSG